MGTTYYQGYLDGFGLDDSLFPLAMDKSLFSGFIALANVGLMPGLYMVLAILALLCAIFFVELFFSLTNGSRWRFIIESKFSSPLKKESTTEETSELSQKVANFLSNSFKVFLIFLSLIMVAYLAGESGQEQAIKTIRSFKNQENNHITLHSPLFPKPTRMMQIVCGQSHCAFWNGNKSLVLRHEQIERIEMYNSTTEGRFER